MNTEEDRIRQFAYQIWESEGRPEGQQARHWEMARRLAGAEGQEITRTPTKTRRITKPRAAGDGSAQTSSKGAARKAPRGSGNPLNPGRP